MSTLLDVRLASDLVNPRWRAWLPVAAGLAVLFLPAWAWLFMTTWSTPEQSHGPLLLLLFAWLAWRRREVLVDGPVAPWPVSGALCLGAGLLLHVLGYSQGIDTVLVAAMLPVLVGVVLLMRGPAPLRALWFPLLFLLFLIPLPGVLVEWITGALKREVSAAVEQILYLASYPIARNGVVLIIGQYQLLVADACSGLNSLFSLSALGLLYLHVTQPVQARRPVQIALLLLLIVPIAFVANVLRVITLVLITWYFGDEAGQGIAHGMAGMVLFLAALLLLLGADQALRRLPRWGRM